MATILLLWYTVFRNTNTTVQELEVPVLNLTTCVFEDNSIQHISDLTGVTVIYIKKLKNIINAVLQKCTQKQLYLQLRPFFFAKNA